MKEQTAAGKLLKGTIVIVAVSVLAKIISFITEAILAGYLGTTYQSDAYYMVASIQNVIYPMLSFGIWTVYLPIYKEKITIGEQKSADELADKVITVTTIASAAVVAVLMAFSPAVVSVVAPGFEGETKRLCAELVRLSAPMYIFIIAAAVYASMLQCHNRFLGSQIREVASHIPTILAAVFLYPKYGIKALAVALVAGGMCRLLIELPFVNWGYRFRPSYRKKSKEFSLMMRRLPSALVSAGVTRLNVLVDKMMASALPAGAVSSLSYGSRLSNVFNGLLSTAVSTAVYPQIVELISLKKNRELNRLLSKIIRVFMVIMIPVTVACILFRRELISVVFERGAFGTESVSLTAGVFACYSAGLFFLACNTVLVNVFYGHGDTKTPMNIGIANLTVNIVLNILMIKMLGTNGLALATSLSSCFVFVLRLILIEKYVQFEWKSIFSTFGKIIIAALIACLIPRLSINMIEINKYLELVLAAFCGVLIYLIELRILKIDELEFIIRMIRNRRAGKKASQTGQIENME